ncbi:hypothetical protein BH11BAC6_BH11BAC6_03200 [soil metagenome]
MLEQKLSYIHSNPCKGKWNLANSLVDYKHSSAKFYLTSEQGFYTITNYKEIEEIDLHNIAVDYPQRPIANHIGLHGDAAVKEIIIADHY